METITDFSSFERERYLWIVVLRGHVNVCIEYRNLQSCTDILCYENRFLTGPGNLKDPDAKFRFPRIFVNTEDSYEELHLIVYKVRETNLTQLFFAF